jgi:uncharacterized sulfatase
MRPIGATAEAAGKRSNILWIICEDLSPILGCYGDRYAHTPNLDRLASEGVRFTQAFSTASVCSPARSCLITGVHATALGTMHLRGLVPLARDVNCFTAYLRRSGYYCSNNEKQDYNFKAPPDAWDESSGTAHWRKRGRAQPFFSMFNLSPTHEGQIRYSRGRFDEITAQLPPAARHDPASAPVPPFYPDTPTIRLNIAELYTQATTMDRQVGELLAQLREDGMESSTIVFFFADHGTGLPGSKRCLRDGGTRVPLIIRFPEAFGYLAPEPAGGAVNQLVSFEDFAPAALQIAGIEQPKYMAGQSFLGPEPKPSRGYVFASRDRVDEALECSRSVRDDRYLYIRNFLPHRPRLQHSTYSEAGLAEQELRRLYREGGLSGNQAWLMCETKPVEELYDMHADPYQLSNLAGDPVFGVVRDRMAECLRGWMIRTRDTGLLPEDEMMRRSGGKSPFDLPQDAWPVERVLDAADLVGRGPDRLPELRALLADPEPAVRYWAAVGVTALGPEARLVVDELRSLQADPAPPVRIAAAEALAGAGFPNEALPVLSACLRDADSRVALQAAAVFWYVGEGARPAISVLEQALTVSGGPKEQRQYAKWCVQKILSRLQSHP